MSSRPATNVAVIWGLVMIKGKSRATVFVGLLTTGLFGLGSVLAATPASADPDPAPPAAVFEGVPAPTLVPAVCDASNQGQRIWDSVLAPVPEENMGYSDLIIDRFHVATLDAWWSGYDVQTLGAGWTSTGYSSASWSYQLPSRLCPGVAPSGPIADVETDGYVCDATTTFAYTGAPENYVVPQGASVAVIQAAGAEAGQLPPRENFSWPVTGKGAKVTSVISVNGAETLPVRVGGAGQFHQLTTYNGQYGPNGGDIDITEQPEIPFPSDHTFTGMLLGGYNGGGRAAVQSNGDTSFSASGGGASDVRRGSALTDRLIVAGGGGAGAGGDGGRNGHDGTFFQGLDYYQGDLFPAAVPVLNQLTMLLPSRGGTQTAGGAHGLLRQEITRFNDDDSIAEQERVDEVVAPSRRSGLGVGGSSASTRVLTGSGYSPLDTHFGGGGGYYGGGAGGMAWSRVVQGDDWPAINGVAGAGGGSSYAVPVPAGMPATTYVDGARKGHGFVSITPCAKRVVSPPEVTPTSNPGETGEVLAKPVGPDGKVLKPQKPAKSLPSTGASVYALPAAILAGVLLAAGAIVLVASRRRGVAARIE